MTSSSIPFAPDGKQLPVAILTGALGSGKTTIIRDLMRRPEMAGTALIVNEFGEVGLDHLLVSSAVETTLLMENGCLCCSLRGDIVDTVQNLLTAAERGEGPPFTRILIETTGLADPVPIIRDLTQSPALAGRVQLACVATCVDGLLGAAALKNNPVALSQLVQADIVFVTKTDLADRADLDALTEQLYVLNPLMHCHEVREGHVPPGDLMFGASAPSRARAKVQAQHVHDNGHHNKHHDHSQHDGVDTLSILLEEPLQWRAYRDWLDLIYSLHAAHMLRLKGFLWVAERDGPVLVQGVGPVLSPVALLQDWPEGRRLTRLVLISKGVTSEALRRSFDAGPGAGVNRSHFRPRQDADALSSG
jgi:G3E family GTPase